MKKSLTSQPQPRPQPAHRKNSTHKKKPHRRSKLSPNPKSRSHPITRNYIISQECPKCPPALCQFCNLSLSPSPLHSPRKVHPKSQTPKHPPKPTLKSPKRDQPAYILSTQNPKTHPPNLLSSPLHQTNLPEKKIQTQDQDPAQNQAHTHLPLKTRLANLEAQEISAQQLQATLTQKHTEIALLQQNWAKFESEKNEFSEAKIMFEAKERQGRVWVEDRKREVEEERLRYEDERLV